MWGVLWMILQAPPAEACGQSTHVWTSLHAVEHLPEGPLRDLLLSTTGELALINGTMFPDGGYSPLSPDAYGEIAHWEPFHDRVMSWVGAPTTDLDGQTGTRLAFLLGLGSHGLGDQIFDAAYLYRSQAYEPKGWAQSGADTGTDVVFVSEMGPSPVVPADVVEFEALQQLFADVGHDVSVSTMQLGQASLRFAIEAVANGGENPEAVAQHRAAFPWATGHLLDRDTAGSPVCIGEAVAAYWQVVYGRWREAIDPTTTPVVYSFPAEGQFGWTESASDPDSMMSLVFSRAIRSPDAVAARVSLTDATGRAIPVDAWMYYGQDSNVLNVRPLDDLTENLGHTLTVARGLETLDGTRMPEITLSFSTEPPPTPTAEVPRGCQTAPLSGVWGVWMVLLGGRRRRRAGLS
ncbi:MAG: Ig-like domain-containing protein [Myxococcota bacterium]